jgi:oligopeptide transport system substrate-binding protein
MRATRIPDGQSRRLSWLRTLMVGTTALLCAGSLLVAVSQPTLARRPEKSLPVLRLSFEVAGVGTLDPALASAANDAEAIALVNANLVHILPNGQVKADLATYAISKNRLVYTFTIRKNARFANGHPVTAADAAFSIQRSLMPSTHSPTAPTYLGLIRGAAEFNAGKAKAVSGLKVVGEHILRITITDPVAYFLETLSFPTADVLDPSVVGGKPVGTLVNGASVGNYLTDTCAGNQGAGPFTFQCRNRGSKDSFYAAGRTPTYTLVPNRYYYGRKPRIQIQLPEYADGYRAYILGKLDESGLPSAHLRKWKGNPELHRYPSSFIDFLAPNTRMAPFNNVHCRLAVAYALNRSTLSNNVSRGTTQPLYAVVPKGILGYYPGKDNPHYNLRRASNELAECPGRATRVVLKYLDFPPVHTTLSAIDHMLKRIGMNIEVQAVSGDEFNGITAQPLDKTGTQIVDEAWTQDYPDPHDYCSVLLRSDAQYNNGQWHNVRYDALVDRADVTANAKLRASLYIEAQHLALSRGAFIPLSNVLSLELLKRYVRGMVGSEAYVDMMPKDLNWANVSISKH